MKIRLYQIVPELDQKYLMFRGLEFIMTKNNGTVPANIYECVFCGDLDIDTPEDVFQIFNINHPKNYSGRSMSVSDIVEFVYSPERSEFFFCDTPCGFPKIQFDKETTQTHRFPAEQVCDVKTKKNKGDICKYSFGSENKSEAIVEIVKVVNEEVREIKFLKVITDDTGNGYFSYLYKTGKTMNASAKYLTVLKE